MVKCSNCAYTGPQETFPRNLRRAGCYVKICQKCQDRKKARNPDQPGRDRDMIATLKWDEVMSLLAEHKDKAFELDTFIHLQGTETLSEINTGKDIATRIAQGVREVTGYRFK